MCGSLTQHAGTAFFPVTIKNYSTVISNIHGLDIVYVIDRLSQASVAFI